MKKKGFTLIEVIISISISATVLVIAYSILNSSTSFIKRNIENLENKSDLEFFQRTLTNDIKNGRELDFKNYKIDNIHYFLRFNRTYGEINLYSLIRTYNDEEIILLSNVIEDWFEINKNGNLYTVKIKYLESEIVKEYQFNIAKLDYNGSIQINIPMKDENEFEYKGYFVTIDFAKNPYVNLIKLNNIDSQKNNQLDFIFYSYDKNGVYDFKLKYNNQEFIYNIGLKYDEEEKFKIGEYASPKPYELNTNKPKIYGIFIKNIELIKNREITIDTSNCDYDVQFEVALSNKSVKLISDFTTKNGNRDKNIKIFYNNGGLHYTNLKEIK